MKVNVHKVEQLIGRIERQGVINAIHYNGSGFCVIGHMGDMCGLMDERMYKNDYTHRKEIPFADSGTYVTKGVMARHANTISEEFGISLNVLDRLQNCNDGATAASGRSDGQTVIDMLVIIKNGGELNG